MREREYISAEEANALKAKLTRLQNLSADEWEKEKDALRPKYPERPWYEPTFDWIYCIIALGILAAVVYFTIYKVTHA